VHEQPSFPVGSQSEFPRGIKRPQAFGHSRQVMAFPDPLDRAGAWSVATEAARDPIGAEGRAELTKRDRFLFQIVAHMVVRPLRAARVIAQGVADGSKRPASKLIQGASADPITRGYLRGGIALKQSQHGLDAKVLR
jgi:hypothetical protein